MQPYMENNWISDLLEIKGMQHHESSDQSGSQTKASVQFGTVLGQMEKRSSHGMILSSKLWLEHTHFPFLYCGSQLLGKLLR